MTEDEKKTPPKPGGRKPYQPPDIESEQVVERQLLIVCYTIFEGCDQDPPQS